VSGEEVQSSVIIWWGETVNREKRGLEWGGFDGFIQEEIAPVSG
jgi:hypothetical protein